MTASHQRVAALPSIWGGIDLQHPVLWCIKKRLKNCVEGPAAPDNIAKRAAAEKMQ
jgi:hypothetical protein